MTRRIDDPAARYTPVCCAPAETLIRDHSAEPLPAPLPARPGTGVST